MPGQPNYSPNSQWRPGRWVLEENLLRAALTPDNTPTVAANLLWIRTIGYAPLTVCVSGSFTGAPLRILVADNTEPYPTGAPDDYGVWGDDIDEPRVITIAQTLPWIALHAVGQFSSGLARGTVAGVI